VSDRKLEQTDYAAKLKAAHLAQIDALTREGLSERERAGLFFKAAMFDLETITWCGHRMQAGFTTASAVWMIGEAPYSLFAKLPACGCPVQERTRGRFKGTLIPLDIERRWSPSVAVLEEFARIQQAARLG
jgi:hypothetical protein